MEQVFLICQVPKDSVDWRRSGVPYDMIIVNVKYPIAKNKTKILVHHMDKKKVRSGCNRRQWVIRILETEAKCVVRIDARQQN